MEQAIPPLANGERGEVQAHGEDVVLDGQNRFRDTHFSERATSESGAAHGCDTGGEVDIFE